MAHRPNTPAQIAATLTIADIRYEQTSINVKINFKFHSLSLIINVKELRNLLECGKKK